MPVTDRYQKIRQYLMGQQDPGDLEALQEQERVAQEQRSVAGYGSAIDKIISSIGGTQANPEPYTQMQKLAGEGPARVREYLKNKNQQRQDNSRLAATMAAAEEQADASRSKEARAEAREVAKGTPGQQEADKKQAADAAEWVSSGRLGVKSGIDRLEDIAKGLENEQDSWADKTRARMGENALSGRQLEIKQGVLNAVIPVLKSLGSNPSEGERKALVDSIYDPRLDPKTNVKNIRRKVSELQAQYEMKDSAAKKYFPDAISPSAGSAKHTATPKMLRVKQKATGATGSIPSDELTDEYEVIQ